MNDGNNVVMVDDGLGQFMHRLLPSGKRKAQVLPPVEPVTEPHFEGDLTKEEFLRHLHGLDGLRVDRKLGVLPPLVVKVVNSKTGEVSVKGVFWAGQKGDHPYSIGVCKINANGTLHKGGKFSGTWFYTPEELASFNY